MTNSTAKSRHNYEYDVLLESDTAPARVIRLAGKGKRILEVGAGPGSITRHLVSTNDCDVVALEIDPSAIEKLREFCDRIYQVDLNDIGWPNRLAGEDKFDVVIAADVLEHVSNPLQTLRGMVSLLRPCGEIILSLPHVSHAVVLASMVDENFEYRDWGLLDRTHIRFFGLRNIEQLYADAGLAIEEAQFVVRTPEMTEFADRWSRMPIELRQALTVSPYSLVYQVVSRARAVGTVSSPLRLMELPVELPAGAKPPEVGFPASPPSAKERLKALARKYLSPETRRRLRSVINKFRPPR